METGKITYRYMEDFIFRVPLLPVDFADYNFILNEIFREALYIASIDLYTALDKLPTKNFDQLPGKMQLSLVKYFSRMRSRCTPFGLFAACSAGRKAEASGIRINGMDNFKSFTRPDMTYLCALSEKISALADLQDDMVLYPNDSLYLLNDAYRYIEHRYIKGERKYFLTEIGNTTELERVLALCRHGASGSELKELLIQQEVDMEEAGEYLNFLIESQVLVNHLYPTVTGKNELLQNMIQGFTSPVPALDETKSLLVNIRDVLKEMDDRPLGRGVHYYAQVEEMVKGTGVAYNQKYLFQSDLSLNAKQAALGEVVFNTASSGFHILNKLSRRNDSALLKKFRDDFLQRYEEEEVPLSEALDPDIGIGFGKLKPGNVSINPFVDGIGIGAGNEPVENKNQHIDDLLQRKYHEFLQKGMSHIEIVDEDVKDFPASYADLPDTMSSMIDVIKAGNTGEPLIIMSAVAGSSAANLAARFCHVDPRIHGIVQDIVDIEDSLTAEDELIAEIVHLPQARTGNILFRPAIRQYEIPYLAGNSVGHEHCIPISDLMVSVKREGIRLRSRRLNKFILPRLTTAHNYMNRSLPVYNFLATVQDVNKRGFLLFSWGKLSSVKCLPRVIYKNIILSPALWNIKPDDTKSIGSPDSGRFLSDIHAFRDKYNIPGKIMIVQGDNKLFIDFEDTVLARLFYHEVYQKQARLEEFLFSSEDPLVTNDDGKMFYSNEVLVFFRKQVE